MGHYREVMPGEPVVLEPGGVVVVGPGGRFVIGPRGHDLRNCDYVGPNTFREQIALVDRVWAGTRTETGAILPPNLRAPIPEPGEERPEAPPQPPKPENRGSVPETPSAAPAPLTARASGLLFFLIGLGLGCVLAVFP